MYPTLLACCNEMGAMLARLLGYVCAIVALGVIAAQMCGLPRVEAAVEPVERADWLAAHRRPRAARKARNEVALVSRASAASAKHERNETRDPAQDSRSTIS